MRTKLEALLSHNAMNPTINECVAIFLALSACAAGIAYALQFGGV